MVPGHYRRNTLLPINSLLEEFFGDMKPISPAIVGFRPPIYLKEGVGYIPYGYENFHALRE